MLQPHPYPQLRVTWAVHLYPATPLPTPPPIWSCTIWSCRGTLSTENEQGFRLPVVAKGTRGLSLRCPNCGRSGGGVGLGPTPKDPPLPPLPSSALPALKKAGTVCYAGAGMFRVFHVASVQSYTGRFIFILPSPAGASCCQSPCSPLPFCSWAPCTPHDSYHCAHPPTPAHRGKDGIYTAPSPRGVGSKSWIPEG